MKMLNKVLIGFGLLFALSYCHKKAIPGNSTGSTDYGKGTGKTLSATGKEHPVKAIKTPVPKVIVVNDLSASKTFDGRMYYDLEGHRYWKNYKDGKYYLFNKTMSTDPAFKKQ